MSSHGPVVAIGPNLVAPLGIRKLAGDPQPVSCAADAALENVACAELPAQSLRLVREALEAEARTAPDHEQFAEARELRDDVLGNAIAKIALVWIAAQIAEREHRDRGTVPDRCGRLRFIEGRVHERFAWPPVFSGRAS